MPSHVHTEARAPMPSHAMLAGKAVPLVAPFLSSSSAAVTSRASHPSCVYGLRNQRRSAGLSLASAAIHAPDLAEVGKALEERLASRRLQPGEEPLDESIDQRGRIGNVEIERQQVTAEMKLRIVIER